MKSLVTAFVFAALILSLGCTKGSSPASSGQATASAKRYHLKGKVVSVDKRANMVNVDSEAIPGFMDAMTMPYTVKPADELDKLAAGDAITADIVVQDDNSWLENIVVTAHGAASPPK